MNITNDDYFYFLDSLRASRNIDMFGAAIYLEEEFNMGPGQANQVLWAWIKSKQPSGNIAPSGFDV